MEMNSYLGAGFYSGDLTENASQALKNIRFAGGLGIGLPMNRGMNLRMQYGYLMVAAKDIESTTLWQQNRGLSFDSKIHDVDLMLILSPIQWWIPGVKWDVQMMGGMAYFWFNPRTVFEGKQINLSELHTEGQGTPGNPAPYRLHASAIIIGMGTSYQINARFSAGIEMLWRKTQTDYLDDLSGKYIDYDVLLQRKGRVAAEIGNKNRAPGGSQRGNSKDSDWFQSIYVNLRYRFAIGAEHLETKSKHQKKLRCPKF